MSLGTWQHLAGRFFSVILAKRLKPGEVDEIGIWLSPEESKAFFAQPSYDQRHGLDSARYVAELLPDRRDLVRAALLHDIGKRSSHLRQGEGWVAFLSGAWTGGRRRTVGPGVRTGGGGVRKASSRATTRRDPAIGLGPIAGSGQSLRFEALAKGLRQYFKPPTSNQVVAFTPRDGHTSTVGTRA
jgi:hypothetical protein